MGNVESGIEGYFYSKYVMSTENEIDFRLQQIEWIEMAKAAGRAEANAQANVIGYGMGGIGSGPNTFNYNFRFWRWVNSLFYVLSIFLIPAALICSVVFMLLRFSPRLVFAATGVFFILFWHRMMSTGSYWQTQLIYWVVPAASLFGGLIMAVIMTFAVYSPLVYNNEELTTKATLGISIGGGIFLLLIIFAYMTIGRRGSHLSNHNPGVPPPVVPIGPANV